MVAEQARRTVPAAAQLRAIHYHRLSISPKFALDGGHGRVDERHNKNDARGNASVNKVLLFCTASVLSCALAGGASAQTAPARASQTATPGPVAEASEVGEVVVTGTRIA